MASRRARIKGIANIPIRRKTDTQSVDITIKSESKSHEKNNDSVNTEQPVSESNPPNTNITDISFSYKTESISQENQLTGNLIVNPSLCCPDSGGKPLETTEQNKSDSQNESQLSEDSKSKDEVSNEVPMAVDTININNNKIVTENNSIPKLGRRWVTKPAIRIPAITRKAKSELIEKPVPETLLSTVKETQVLQNNENALSEKNVSTEQILTLPSNAVTDIGKLPDIKPTTELERSLVGAMSPSRILNRRIKPVPKLIRRNSIQGSASESEDDGRKSRGRIRNDSICSTTSHSMEYSPTKDGTFKKEQYTPTQRKFRRSDQSRKIAEARREFYHKFGANVPDKKRLTMIDLIYYNPTTNPLPERKVVTKTDVNKIEEIDEKESENIDDPDIPDDPKSDEESVPVPQVKVGPNGEIILDEQSLVIEQTGTKKGREQLANSQVVMDDLDRTYGVYKRPKRAKDWNTMETLRFYRALHTVGTDFSLMVSLFPGRTRRQLKMKFKKEERLNKTLIDKALLNPIEFDLTELEKQLEDEERLSALKITEKNKKKVKVPRLGRPGMLSTEMDEEVLTPKNPRRKTLKRVKKEKKKSDLYSVLENGLEEIFPSDSGSDQDFKNPIKMRKVDDKSPRPTRSCNGKKSAKYVEENQSESEDDQNLTTDNEKATYQPEDTKYQPDETNYQPDETNYQPDETFHSVSEDSEDNSNTNGNEEENKQLVRRSDCAEPNILPDDLPNVEPGSLMILSTDGPDGKKMFKVFMVTPGKVKVPVNLSPEIVQSLTSSLGNAETVTLDLPVIESTTGTEPVEDGDNAENILST